LCKVERVQAIYSASPQNFLTGPEVPGSSMRAVDGLLRGSRGEFRI
jgi:hypothetical protein